MEENLKSKYADLARQRGLSFNSWAMVAFHRLANENNITEEELQQVEPDNNKEQ